MTDRRSSSFSPSVVTSTGGERIILAVPDFTLLLVRTMESYWSSSWLKLEWMSTSGPRTT